MKLLPPIRVAGSALIATLFFTAAVRAGADEIDELKEQMKVLARRIEILEQQQSGEAEAGDRSSGDALTVEDARQDIKLPGTETSLRIGGFVKPAIIYDIDPRPTSRGGDVAAASSAILEGEPEYENRGDTRITARNSRFNLTTYTPTRFGQVKTFLEGDFNGPPHNKGSRATTNRTAFEIRHAYGEVRNVLFGQYWTNFSDNSVFPYKIDGSGPVGRTFMRQGQIRYTHEMGNGGKLAVALENPRGDFHDADDHNLADKYPDITARYRYEQSRWHVQFAGLMRQIGINEGMAGRAKDSVTGWGLSQSAALKLPGTEDRFSWYVALGEGIGRYLDGGKDQGASISANGDLNTQFGYGGFLAFQHWWTPTLQTNVDFGLFRYRLNPEEDAEANRRLHSSRLNLVWLPTDNLRFGVEYVWGQREVHDGRQGSIRRVGAHSVFLF